MKNFIENLCLKVIFKIANFQLQRAIVNSKRLQELILEKEFILQFRTKSDGAYFELKNGKIDFHFGIHPLPTLTYNWKNGFDAVRVLLNKDETEMLRAFEAGIYRMEGDFTVALWFNEAMKIARK